MASYDRPRGPRPPHDTSPPRRDPSPSSSPALADPASRSYAPPSPVSPSGDDEEERHGHSDFSPLHHHPAAGDRSFSSSSSSSRSRPSSSSHRASSSSFGTAPSSATSHSHSHSHSHSAMPMPMPFPPPPQPVATSSTYDLPPPPTPTARRGRPLPSVPSSARFVPLHPLPLPPPPTPAAGGKGKARAPSPTAQRPDPAVEAKRAYARARGLDELDSGAGGGAGGGGGGEGAESPSSPAGSELPRYADEADDPVGFERQRSLLKRSLSYGGYTGAGSSSAAAAEAEAAAAADKAARELESVRRSANEDARAQVEEDARASKAAVERRMREEERERQGRERGREEARARKRLEGLRVEEERGREREEGVPPPSLSPGSMLPLVGDSKRRAAEEGFSPSFSSSPPLVSPPQAPQHYRLPPPPVPISSELRYPTYPATAPLPPRLPPPTSALPPPPTQDYFSLAPPSSRPPPVHSYTAPAPPTRPLAPSSRPETTRHASLAPPSTSTSEFYAAGISPYGASSRYIPSPAPALQQERPAAQRQGSMGPASAFYNAGVGLAMQEAAVKRLSPHGHSPLSAGGSASSPSSPLSCAFPDSSPTLEPERPTLGHRSSMSWSQPGSLPPPGSFATASHSTSSAATYRASQPAPIDPAGLAQFGVRVPSSSPSRTLTTSTFASSAPTAHPSAFPAAPAFYTSVTPGGPLLPFYPSPSVDGGAPTSFFSPTGTGSPAHGVLGLPPPPAPVQQSYRTSLSQHPPGAAVANAPFLTSSSPHRASSAADNLSLRPWSRSSSASPGSGSHFPLPAGQRATRMSTIRNLFGRKGKAGGAEGLSGTPEEEGR
ncbi:hypothetical protein JCM10213_006433 [Rhodosporidiobolus nylandii]